MAKLLVVGTHGTEDPTRATFPFMIAKEAAEEGVEVVLFLTNDAVLLLKDYVADAVQGIGIPPLKELARKVYETRTKVFV